MLNNIKDPVERFFAYAKERHQIYLNRTGGKPFPWTKETILQEYRFTNVFRELDKTTVWFRENIRDRLRDDPRVLFATVCFRWFNRIETGIALGDLCQRWNPDKVRFTLRELPVLVTGAFIVRSPDGYSKLDGLVNCIDKFWKDNKEWENDLLLSCFSSDPNIAFPTLENLTRKLTVYPMMGRFMAYEVASDMRHTAFYENAPDIMTWANPGPGAKRGLQRIKGVLNPKEQPLPNPQKDAKCVEEMQGILAKVPDYWPKAWPQWEMREVEHTLCEFDKFERVRLGQGKPRGRYNFADYSSNLQKSWGSKDLNVVAG